MFAVIENKLEGRMGQQMCVRNESDTLECLYHSGTSCFMPVTVLG